MTTFDKVQVGHRFRWLGCVYAVKTAHDKALLITPNSHGVPCSKEVFTFKPNEEVTV